jgi:signal transduction histidine kinase
MLVLTLSFTVAFDCRQVLHGSILEGVIHSTVILAITVPTFLISSLLSRSQYSLAENRERTKRLGYAIENLSKVNKDLQDYAELSKSVSAEEERNRITRDMHDLVGYALTNVIMLMNATRAVLSDKPDRLPEAMQMVEQTRAQAEDALQEARQILYQLRAVASNDPIGLQALARLVKVFSQITHIEVSFHYGNLPMSNGERIDKTVYQIVQEGLTNVVRHGKADRITISLWQTEEDILVSVRDNGTGAYMLREGIGLKGMRERLSLLRGDVDAHAEPYGFVLTARIPVGAATATKDGDVGSYQDHDC